MAFNIVLFDDFAKRTALLPLVATRPVGNLRVGVLTINQKWAAIFKTTVSYLTITYLRKKFPLEEKTDLPVLIIKANVLPSEALINLLRNLEINQCLVDCKGDWIAAKVLTVEDFSLDTLLTMEHIKTTTEIVKLKHPEDIYINNAQQILFDLPYLSVSKLHHSMALRANVLGDEVYVKDNVSIEGALLDSSKGPIYIGSNTLIEAGVMIYGPVAIGDNCRVKAGAVLYPNVTLGDLSTVCGEINNVVIWGSSSKGHEGYLGCAVLGEGCNLGAGTVNSNLKNDWSTVKLYDYSMNNLRDTSLSKCGVIIADHVMLGVQSKINTGTVIGVGSQIAMSKFIPKFVPDFSWYTDENQDTYIFERFVKMMHRKSELRQEDITADDKLIWQYIHKNTEDLRN